MIVYDKSTETKRNEKSYNHPDELSHFSNGILDNQTCQHEAEDGCDVGDGAVTLVVGVDGQLIFQEFVGIDTLELATGEHLFALEAVAEGARQGVTLNLPEFSHLNFGGIEFQGSTH